METSTDRVLSVTRILNAPVELVWEAWTNPEHLKNWWGPDGFTNTIHEMDVRPGGKWKFIMHGPDGTDYRNESEFVEIVLYKKIVYDHITAPKFRVTATFEEMDDKTKFTMTGVFESAEQLQQVIKTFGADEGMKQNVNRLENYLISM